MKLLTLFIIVFLFGCNTWKQSLIIDGNQDDAIYNAILDFSHTSKLFNQHSVFSIRIEDPLFSRKLIEVEDGSYKWILDEEYEGIIGVSILGYEDYIYHIEDVEVGSKGKFPSRYIVKKSKLFYWNDDSHPLSQEVVEMLIQYNILKKIESFVDVENVIDDGQKGATYYFCRNDLSRYKKVISTVAMGYEFVQLSCP